MSRQTPTTPAMNPGSSTNLAAETLKENNKKTGVSRGTLNEFLENVAGAMAMGPQDGEDMPWIEVTRDVLEHFNRGQMAGVDKAGYFVFQGVKVYEQGKREEAKLRDSLTSEQILFGTK